MTEILTPSLPAPDPYAPRPPQPPWAAPAPPPAKPPRRRRTVALVATTALLAGATGGVVGAAVAPGERVTTTVTSTPTATGTPTTTVAVPDGSIEKVAAAVLPSVVSVQVSGAQGSGEGSGVILSTSGYVLTNNHVVEGASRLTVRLQDGRSATATVVGTDPTSDLAVIRISGLSGLTPATLGSSGALKVGQTVVAVGSPLGLEGTVTAGIVSALNRPVTTGGSGGQNAILDAIQTDAAINPGNSGGALADLDGKVVGINSAIATLGSSVGGTSGSIGLGFAIPIDQAKRIADEIIRQGYATRAQLGVGVADADQGAALSQVTAGGPADRAGLRSGDVVTRFGERPIDSADALVAAIRSARPGQQVTITYERAGRSATATVTLGSARS